MAADHRGEVPIAMVIPIPPDIPGVVMGPQLVIFGGLDCARLARMTVPEVEAHARAILAERRSDPRFVLGTSGPDVPLETAPESIHALRSAVAHEATTGGAA